MWRQVETADLSGTGGLLPSGDGGGKVGQKTVGVVDELSRGITKDGESRLS